MEALLLPDGYQLEHHEMIDSTNEAMKRKLQDGQALDKLVMVADQQYAGRGRRGREWVSESGNLFISFLHRLVMRPEYFNFYSIAAGLAVRELVVYYVGEDVDVKWKWPNDVLLAGKKISGILLEQVTYKGDIWLISGVGVNIASSPNEGVMWQTASLQEGVNQALKRDEIVKTFVKYLHSYYKRVSEGNVEALIDACRLHAANVNQPITVRLQNEELHGVFEGIDDQGNLLLMHENGIRPISAGDIFFKE